MTKPKRKQKIKLKKALTTKAMKPTMPKVKMMAKRDELELHQNRRSQQKVQGDNLQVHNLSRKIIKLQEQNNKDK